MAIECTAASILSHHDHSVKCGTYLLLAVDWKNILFISVICDSPETCFTIQFIKHFRRQKLSQINIQEEVLLVFVLKDLSTKVNLLYQVTITDKRKFAITIPCFYDSSYILMMYKLYLSIAIIYLMLMFFPLDNHWLLFYDVEFNVIDVISSAWERSKDEKTSVYRCWYLQIFMTLGNQRLI